MKNIVYYNVMANDGLFTAHTSIKSVKKALENAHNWHVHQVVIRDGGPLLSATEICISSVGPLSYKYNKDRTDIKSIERVRLFRKLGKTK